MEQGNDFFNGSPKTMFFSGFISGVALLAVVAAVFFANMAISEKTPTAEAGDNNAAVVVEDEGTTIPADNGSADLPPITSEDHILGDVSKAKVVLVEYSDFECPYCTNHYETLKSIMDEYGDDVALVYRHFPLSFHPDAIPAAVASECADEQGKFWEYHDELFANSNNLGDDTYETIAVDLGLNVSDFMDCYESGKYENEIAAEMNAGASAGVTGTPATFVNGTKVSGAVPFATFQGIIEEEL